jgi:hypothetical protein
MQIEHIIDSQIAKVSRKRATIATDS